jgi:Tfp pilus assembly PilM family ATPase
MVKKLAIDWDESELRLVAAQCSGSNVKVTDARVIPIEDNVLQTLKAVLDGQGMENTEALVAIGRGQAELRELQLPPVPEEELPDMVRFQASKSFATAGDNATVDYLVTSRNETGVEMIAAALGSEELNRLRGVCESGSLVAKRICIRPLSAAALYLLKQERASANDTVLIDLLSDEAEIVVAREGRVIFVRTVRMPSAEDARGRALAGELKRSLVACGSSGTLERVVLWGRAAVHSQDVEMLVEATDSKVEVLDPFSLVDVDRNTKGNMPEHVGRLAPLVGLLVADETGADRLLDFLNPRKRVEVIESPYRKYVIAAVPVAIAALVAFFIYRQLGALDVQIEGLKMANNDKQKGVKAADVSIARTELVDKYLDGDVNWLNEIRRLASKVPESDKLIVRSVSAVSDTRNGGGTMTIEGAVTKPAVIEEFEGAIRDDFRTVQGDGASELRTSDQYRWSFTETIKIDSNHIRDQRYIGISEVLDETDSAPKQEDPAQNAGDVDRSPEDRVVPENDTAAGVGEGDESPSIGAEEGGAGEGGAGEGGAGADSGESTQGNEADSGEESPETDDPLPEQGTDKAEAGDNPTEGGPEKELETSPGREPAAGEDDEVVAEIRTEVKS